MFISKTAGGMIAILFGTALVVTGAQPGRVTLSGHVPAATAALTATGQLPATNTLSLAIGLPLRNQEQLTNLLRELYDPASTNFHKFIKPVEFAARFGPTEADYAAVRQFAESNGFTVTGTHSNRVVLDVRAQSGDVERAFHVKLRTYPHPKEARSFYAPDAEPTVDAGLPVVHISGLNNYATKRPMGAIKPLIAGAGVIPNSGSSHYGTYIGNDFRNAYVPGTALTGSGQSVALLQFDGFYSNDIAAYAKTAGNGRTNIVIQTVLLDGFDGVPVSNDGNVEVSLDIEMAMSMAPGLDKIIVYEGTANTDWSVLLSRIADDNLARQISCSWSDAYIDPSYAFANSFNDWLFQQMAAQGQSFFNASGDFDAFVGSAPFPLDDLNITLVGGTVLTMNGTAESYASETVWNDRTVNPNGGNWGSSGGVSASYSIPWWQTNINMTTNHGSTTMRNMPDVALTAAGIYLEFNNGTTNYTAEGTSCAAPLWAGFCALVNQQAAAIGNPSVGFINPAIYALAASTNYNRCFHDTTTGSNTWSGSLTNFYAVPGYDLCTGLGTPNGTNLITALAGTYNDQPLIRNSGFETGTFAGWTLAGTTNVGDVTDNAVVDASFITGAGGSYVHSGTFGAVLGGGGLLATLSQTVPTVSGQDYRLSWWLENPTNRATEIFQVIWNTNTIYAVTNPPVFGWTNLIFVVTGGSASSKLQFAAENGNDFFGLDDVSLTPIPAPSVTALVKTTNGLTFTWNSLAGLTYLVQYKTNLLQPNWITLTTNTATDITNSFTSDLTTDARRFFRIRRQP